MQEAAVDQDAGEQAEYQDEGDEQEDRMPMVNQWLHR